MKRPEIRRLYLQVPKDLQEPLDALLQQIFPEGYEQIPELQKAQMISDYLSSNYTYSLYPELPKGVERHPDPVINFLERTKQGHCELFASAGVLLMRRAGLPARYISGVLCNRKSPNGNFYFATGDNLHAWLEVYLDDYNQTWYLCDPTPADYLEAIANSDRGAFQNILDWIKATFDNLYAYVKRGYLMRFFKKFWLILAGCIAVTVLLVTLLLFLRKRHRHDKIYKYKTSLTSPHLRKLQKKMQALIKHVSSRTRTPIRGSQTLEEWFESLPAYARHEQLKFLIKNYEALRFKNHDVISRKSLSDFDVQIQLYLHYLKKAKKLVGKTAKAYKT